MNPFLATDGYKTGHHKMYPQGTTLVYSNFTPRSNKYAPKGCDKVVSFGQQMVMQQIHELFNTYFFKRSWSVVGEEIKREYSLYLNEDYNTDHIYELWKLGYLPIRVKAIKEGTLVPIGVPVLTIVNTNSDFYWLTNFLETLISTLLWKALTSATIANSFRNLLLEKARESDIENLGFVDYQAHDFSMRGMDSLGAVVSSGIGHALSFLGFDGLPVIHGARKYYDELGAVGHSINATEHSVMCAGGDENELETFRYLMKQFPTGNLSIVSDTWDLWKVLTIILPTLKEEILTRDGKVVIRPDSGDPVEIICGKNTRTIVADSYEDFLEEAEEILHEELTDQTPHGECGGDISDRFYYDGKLYDVNYKPDWNRYDKQYYFIENFGGNKTTAKELEVNPADKGVIELLWDLFGGTINKQGYKVLDPHIGAIYGDSINRDRAERICERLMEKGFATTNMVFGIGSFTYQFNTRDTFGFAMKATYVEVLSPCEEADDCTNYPEDCKSCVNIKPRGRTIFKDPITDDGTKKSAKGLLRVNEDMTLSNEVSWKEEAGGMLEEIYCNGWFEKRTTITEIRETLKKENND
jgi:nicotinamide phosphoribosyltransferase